MKELNPFRYQSTLTKVELSDILVEMISESIRKGECSTEEDWQRCVDQALDAFRYVPKRPDCPKCGKLSRDIPVSEVPEGWQINPAWLTAQFELSEAGWVELCACGVEKVENRVGAIPFSKA